MKLQSYKVTKNKQVTKLQSYNRIWMMIMQKLNTCYYSPGTDRHECCTHQHYCIFNPNRIRLETNIIKLENELHQRIHDLKFIKNEGTNNSADYEATRERITILNTDLENLRKSRKKIIENKEVKGYGNMEIQ